MESAGGTWRLGYRPGLDGIRGLAVLLVVYAHATDGTAVAGAALGRTGVTVFFVLSGFLITNLLLEELNENGRIDLSAFYRRRGARLLPALVTMLILSLSLGLVTGAGALAALLYVANWFQALTGQSDGLAHMWSLAVEEQFYIVWPLVLVALSRLPRWVLFVVALAGAIAAVAARAASFDGSWISEYQVQRMTHTSADALLLGCGMAVVLHRYGPLRWRPQVATGALAAIVVIGAVSASVLWLSVAVGVLSVMAVVATCADTYRGWLTARPLVYVGRRSYAIYLWHIPMISLAGRLGFEGAMRPGLGVLLAFLAAGLSWRYIERPCMRLRVSSARSHVETSRGAAAPA